MSTIFADSRMVWRYRRMDNGPIIRIDETLLALHCIEMSQSDKHLFVKTREAPFGNTDTFSWIFKVNGRTTV